MDLWDKGLKWITKEAYSGVITNDIIVANQIQFKSEKLNKLKGD